MHSSALLAFAASLATTEAVYKGFNYGATKADDYTVRVQSDFETLFSTAKNLVGTSGFTSARLYTTIQGGTTNTPTSAIPAAIAQDTSLLLTLWASGDTFSDELAALNSAISQYGTQLTGKVAGISVGSEDLYRLSPTGVAAGSTVGQEPSVLVDYIAQVRKAIAGTALSSVGVGHVDTWTAWVNSSNDAVITASDWIGVDAYPYFQNTESNGIDSEAAIFNAAIANTKAAVGSKEVWITETGFPVSGKTENLAVPGVANAKTYWDQVGCPNFDVVNTWWYTLEDNDDATPNPSFGITDGVTMSTTPYFDLSCSNVTSSNSSSAATASADKSSTATLAPASSAVSSGTGLSPSGHGGSGANVTGTASGATATGSSGNSTGLKTSATPTASKTSTSTAVSTGAASLMSGSFIGAIGALIVAAAAL